MRLRDFDNIKPPHELLSNVKKKIANGKKPRVTIPINTMRILAAVLAITLAGTATIYAVSNPGYILSAGGEYGGWGDITAKNGVENTANPEKDGGEEDPDEKGDTDTDSEDTGEVSSTRPPDNINTDTSDEDTVSSSGTVAGSDTDALPDTDAGSYTGVLPGTDASGPNTDVRNSSTDDESGLLTAGKWNDNDNWEFFLNLMAGQNQYFKTYAADWNIDPTERYAVKVSNTNGESLGGVGVVIYDSKRTILYRAVTDNSGMAYLFRNKQSGKAASIKASLNGKSVYADVESDIFDYTMEINTQKAITKKLDIMFCIDTTGSMDDELYYLQNEMVNVIERAAGDNANINIRVGSIVYRDEDDDYITESTPFTKDWDKVQSFIRQQKAAGGGDFPEAVDSALDEVLSAGWESDSVKICFLVCDAPPHSESAAYIARHIVDAAARGIRIIPIASSGIDKSTEYILRCTSLMTGGTYAFLTDDSGVGGEHIAPTIGAYDVYKLNDLMVDIVNSYVN